MNKLRKPSRSTVLKAAWIIYAVLSSLFLLPQIDHMITSDSASTLQYLSLDDSWDISINDASFENVSLDTFRFQAVDKDDVIVMRRKLPDHWNFSEGTLRLHIRQSAVTVSIDDTPVYEYGYDRLQQNKTVGSGLQFINFPNEYQGKMLKIRLCLSEDNAFSRFDPIRIYEWSNAYRALITENRFPLFLGCFLTIFGLVLNFITIFALVVSRKYLRVFCISVFSILMGLWTLCYYNVILIFSIPLYTVSLLEYVVLFFAPLPLLIYMWEDVRKLKWKGLKNVYYLLFLLQMISTIWTITLHALDIVHFAATLKYLHTLIVISLVYFIIVELISLKKSHASDRLFLIGMLIISGCITYDLADYCLNRYLGIDTFSLKGITSFGVVIFIFIMIASFYMNLTQKMMQEKERNFLIKSAYTDELTQIHNRRYCIEYMNRIRDAESLDYTVICFDVNNLKIINDTYGHARGDVLIRSAAEAIAETFEDSGIVARMGGDEFIAIIETSDPQTVNTLLEQFARKVQQKNEKDKDLHMSIAYGCASCSTKEYNIEKIFQTADDRMYENKKRMKAEAASGGHNPASAE